MTIERLHDPVRASMGSPPEKPFFHSPAAVDSTRCTHNKRPPEGGLSANRKMGVQAYAAATLRRRQAISPPSAITIPGSPAPAIGPGTAAVLTTIFTSATGVL